MPLIGWIAVYVIGIAGWVCVQRFINWPQSGRAHLRPRNSCYAFALIVAFGVFCCVLGHFGPRQLSAFWPIYFMLFYSIAGLWFGYAFIVIATCRVRADAGRLFLCRQRLRSVDALSMAAGLVGSAGSGCGGS